MPKRQRRKNRVKLKTLPLLILFLLTLTPAIYGQTPPESPDGQNNGYGIEPDKLYPGIMVLEILAVAEVEIDTAAEEAYAEGYKAAALRFAPEIESLRLQLETAQRQRTVSIQDRLVFGFGGFVLGIFSFGIYSLVPK
jgi:hypothetical protein